MKPKARRMTATLPHWLAAAIREIHTGTGVPLNRLKESILADLFVKPENAVEWAWQTYLDNTGPPLEARNEPLTPPRPTRGDL